MGLINEAQKQFMDTLEPKCHKLLRNKNFKASTSCLRLVDDITNSMEGGELTVTSYDTSFWMNKNEKFPPGEQLLVSTFGGSEKIEILQAIHADEFLLRKGNFKMCGGESYRALAHQDGLGVVDELVKVLDHISGPRIMFYNGMRDLVCNHVGNELFLNQLPWSKSIQWVLSNRFAWTGTVGRTPLGYVKEYKNLIYLKLRNAGHMVPMDLPEVSLDMMRTFIYHKTFKSNSQVLSQRFPVKKNDNGKCMMCPKCDFVDRDKRKLDNVLLNREIESDSTLYSRSSFWYIVTSSFWYGISGGASIILFLIYVQKLIQKRNQLDW